jgi:hypothetical protein
MKKNCRVLSALFLCLLLLLGAGLTATAEIVGDTADGAQTPFYLQGSQIVYVTATGKCYHSISDCGSTKTACALSLEEACRLGYTQCSKCGAPAEVTPEEDFAFPEGSVIVYISVGTSCYHSTPDCGSLKDAVAVTLEEAVYLGRKPCKKCHPPE